MATNTERIYDLALTTATLSERIDHLRTRLENLENKFSTELKGVQDSASWLKVHESRLKEIDAKLDHLSSRGWEVRKLVFAAILGGVSTVLGGVFLRLLERAIAPAAKQSETGRTVPNHTK